MLNDNYEDIVKRIIMRHNNKRILKPVKNLDKTQCNYFKYNELWKILQ